MRLCTADTRLNQWAHLGKGHSSIEVEPNPPLLAKSCTALFLQTTYPLLSFLPLDSSVATKAGCSNVRGNIEILASLSRELTLRPSLLSVSEGNSAALMGIRKSGLMYHHTFSIFLDRQHGNGSYANLLALLCHSTCIS